MKYGGDGSLIGRLHDAADDGRVAAHQAVGRDGFDNDGVGADDAPAADAHARQNRCFVADPYVVFDDNGAFGGEGALAGVPVGPCELSVMVTHRPVKTPLPMRMPENDLKNLECCYLFVGVSTGRVK